ncbi:phosphonatase-like hydrolase [Streptodolium elevatio]|uniref:Phosphonatase-like hydrolase n=1 Tax=Streptodolium elevatio TaxID=3157996 RepID=A0ABV3DD19_9ACTN
MTRTQLVVLDMAGTTVADDGLVVAAFTRAIASVGVAEGSDDYARMLAYVHDTMGESKISVFRALLDQDEDRAQHANAAFEAAYGDLVAGGACAPVDGAEEAIAELRTAGVKVALTTGFGGDTQQAILKALGWTSIADLVLCPADAGRGRPYPDLVLTAVLRLGVDDVRAVATAGDTAFDVLCGLRAGASVAAGVLTGAHDRAALEQAGATHVLDSVRDLPAVVLGDPAATPGR